MPKRKNRKYIIYFVVIATICISISAFIIISRIPKSTELEMPDVLVIPDLSTNGYMKVSVDAAFTTDKGLISLSNGCYELIANTEPQQAESIINGLSNKIDVRPNTHDLMKDGLDGFEIQVLMVKIVDMKNNTFIGNLIMKKGNRILNLDSKPSDAIALAVRAGAPIYIKEDLMKSEGTYIC
jgi:bifunctional DNase/RNase